MPTNGLATDTTEATTPTQAGADAEAEAAAMHSIPVNLQSLHIYATAHSALLDDRTPSMSPKAREHRSPSPAAADSRRFRKEQQMKPSSTATVSMSSL
uniref:Uncharacterized protein n=1 Tax=Plectus sambesii TaxID=2011161 RepID=A0A914W905_9BILA